MMNLLFAAFLVAHAAIHLSFLAPRPPATAGGPPWPFDLSHSALLGPLGAGASVVRPLGMALIAVTVVAYVVAALVILRVAPDALWLPSVVIGSVASLGLLGLFFHPWLVLGIGLDLALIWAVTIARWQPA